MKIGKICKGYAVIGMLFAAYGMSEYKKEVPDKYNELTFKQKVKVFIGLTLTWPDPIIAGFMRVHKNYKAKMNKESGNEFES